MQDQYTAGLEPPNFPVPALASTSMYLCLNHPFKVIDDKQGSDETRFAWDGKWEYGLIAPFY